MTNLGNIVVLLLICVVLYFAGKNKDKKVALIAILGLAITSLLVSIIKPTVGELRPFLVLPHVNLLVQENGMYSFPSGHTSLVFTIATILGLSYKFKNVKLIYITLAIATIVGFSRIYLGVHYPVDVFGGIIVGVLSGLLSLKLGEGIFKKLGVYNGIY
ncbi:phosphatase PAP2 family protein [uncultured Methanobrevibacter sp.]|uniref:phosphatase PAP2 family protein n=1 Tax=uncultured Methanobrevibacter sp. TaxID=253161 RepID=UPI002617DDA5|nr:phosphatase PAP2 family protein [uncultured Methanobrevibacter sp.]